MFNFAPQKCFHLSLQYCLKCTCYTLTSIFCSFVIVPTGNDASWRNIATLGKGRAKVYFGKSIFGKSFKAHPGFQFHHFFVHVLVYLSACFPFNNSTQDYYSFNKKLVRSSIQHRILAFMHLFLGMYCIIN